MNKKGFKKLNILLLVMIIGISMLCASCSTIKNGVDNNIIQGDPDAEKLEISDDNSIQNKEGNTTLEGDNTRHEDGEDPKVGWKTDEIFDLQRYDGKLTINFFHIGIPVEGRAEGDLFLIKAPDGATILVDAGYPECGPKLVEFFKKMDIKKLDYIIGTHMHIDHIGGFPDVLDYLDVGKVLMPSYMEYNTSPAKRFLSAIDSKNVPVKIVKKGDTFKLGKYVDIEILSPELEIEVPKGEVSNDFVNDNSVVFRMRYEENTFLFTSDIQREQENKLIEENQSKLNSDLIKVPHHGSGTSSSIGFIEAVDPKVAIMTSVSPKKEVYNRYKRKGSEILITGLDGNLLVISDGEKVEIIQEHERSIKGYYE